MRRVRIACVVALTSCLSHASLAQVIPPPGPTPPTKTDSKKKDLRGFRVGMTSDEVFQQAKKEGCSPQSDLPLDQAIKIKRGIGCRISKGEFLLFTFGGFWSAKKALLQEVEYHFLTGMNAQDVIAYVSGQYSIQQSRCAWDHTACWNIDSDVELGLRPSQETVFGDGNAYQLLMSSRRIQEDDQRAYEQHQRSINRTPKL